MLKSRLRKKILKIRKLKNYRNVNISLKTFFSFLKKKKLTRKSIGGYFPVNFEIDDLKILKFLEKKNYQISLPITKKNFDMDFHIFNFSDPLNINKYGIPEPNFKKLVYPDIILVPLIAFDNRLNRLGYGGGYYDRFIEKISKKKTCFKNRISVINSKN